MLLPRETVRRTLRAPMVPATMALVLSLGFGVSAAVFTVVHAVVLSDGGFPDGDRLLAAAVGAGGWSVPMFDAARASNTTFDAMFGVHERSAVLDGPDGAEVIRLEAVSLDSFAVLGARPGVGGTWDPVPDTAGPAGAVALVSHSLWQRRFAADAGVTGRTIVVEGTRLVVLGVLPQDFRGLVGRTDIWVPLRFVSGFRRPDARPEGPFSRWFEVVGRMNPELDLGDARARFEQEASRAMATIPGSAAGLGVNWRARLTPLDAARRDVRWARAATVILAAVVLVLILASLNLASLYLTGVMSRAKEFAVRAAIGGARRHIAGPILSEILLIVTAGMAGGFALRGWFLRALLADRPAPTTFGLASADIFQRPALAVDWMIAAFVVACAAVVTLGLALGPMLRVGRPSLEAILREGTGTRASLGSPFRLRWGGAIRLALGATPAGVFGLMTARVAVVAAAGTLAGSAVAVIATKALSGFLHGVSPRDPLTLLAVVGTVWLAAICAAWRPACRAMRVDPVTAIRGD